MKELSHYIPRILIIDDEKRIRDGCRAVLSKEGYEVASAKDGKQGLKMIELQHYDIVLLDLMMPQFCGFDVLPAIKSLHPDSVIIVITGYATLEHSIKAIKKGAFDFIPKPFTPEQLTDAISSTGYTHMGGKTTLADDFIPKPIALDKLMEMVADNLT